MTTLSEEANSATGENTKVSNPKDAIGAQKARWFSYIPLRVLAYVGLALFEGARKYGKHNYREAGVRASVYVDACVNGHLQKWWEGEDIDPDTCELDEDGKPIPGTGLNHIDKAIASLVVLRDGMLESNWTDDRAPAIDRPDIFWADLDSRAKAIIARYPDAKEPFTQERRTRERALQHHTEMVAQAVHIPLGGQHIVTSSAGQPTIEQMNKPGYNRTIVGTLDVSGIDGEDDPYSAKFPHCDELVLHAPGECYYCDKYPQKQQERIDNGVNFTGYNDPIL